MASAYRPIAKISATDQGPINTVATIIFIVTSLLFSTVRYILGKKKLLQIDADDIVYVVALVSICTCAIIWIRSVLGQKLTEYRSMQ